MRMLVMFFAIAVFICLSFGMSSESSAGLSTSDAVFTIFFTGNEMGTLKPCGCSGGQLGGLERRRAIFESVAKTRRMIVDTGMLIDGGDEQEMIKFGIVTEAYNLLGYDFVNLTKDDLEMAKNLGISSSGVLNFISAWGSDEKISSSGHKKFSLSGKDVVVNIISSEAASVSNLKDSLAKESGSINILILDECNDVVVDLISKMDNISCVICPAESDEPMKVSDVKGKPLFITVGRRGKYVAKVEVKSNLATKKYELSFSSVPVAEHLHEDEDLAGLYKSYQLLVKEADIMSMRSRFTLDDDLEYVGSDKCQKCHKYENAKWSELRHAGAFETLVDVGSDFDPECVSCHVVGYDYVSGFVSIERTETLKGVGCEVCHGPGSKHVETFGEALTNGPKLDCTACHTPEHSAKYSGNEDSYFKKIIHWQGTNEE